MLHSWPRKQILSSPELTSADLPKTLDICEVDGSWMVMNLYSAFSIGIFKCTLQASDLWVRSDIKSAMFSWRNACCFCQCDYKFRDLSLRHAHLSMYYTSFFRTTTQRSWSLAAHVWPQPDLRSQIVLLLLSNMDPAWSHCQRTWHLPHPWVLWRNYIIGLSLRVGKTSGTMIYTCLYPWLWQVWWVPHWSSHLPGTTDLHCTSDWLIAWCCHLMAFIQSWQVYFPSVLLGYGRKPWLTLAGNCQQATI